MREYEIIIHAGPHFTHAVLMKYFAVGSREQLLAGAETHLKQKRKTGRFWVDVIGDLNAPVTHFNVEILS